MSEQETELIHNFGKILSKVGKMLYFDDIHDAEKGEVISPGSENITVGNIVIPIKLGKHIHHFFIGQVLFNLGEELKKA